MKIKHCLLAIHSYATALRAVFLFDCLFTGTAIVTLEVDFVVSTLDLSTVLVAGTLDYFIATT